MKRILAAPAFLLVLLGATQRHAMADDLVYYRAADTGKEAKDSPLKGKITREGPGGVTIALGRGNRVIPALDVIQIAFVTKDTDVSSYRSPYSKIEAALGLNLTTKAKDAAKPSERRSRTSRTSPRRTCAIMRSPRATSITVLPRSSTTWPSTRHSRLKRSRCWRITPRPTRAAGKSCSRLKNLSRLYEEAGNVEKASATLARLADLPEVPKDIKREGDLAVSPADDAPPSALTKPRNA